ncbi:MAG: NYN domain-containing protein [Microthrixaceae bacterium]|nr:NYN domain-containing protein [Microthrixaceae bacterium]
MTAELDLLRPALELAIAVARRSAAETVPVTAPRAIQPFLRFSKLPPRALNAARTALDDDEFRERVAGLATEGEVGRAGWLWLTRPDGWRDEFDAMVRERTARVEEGVDAATRRELARTEELVRSQQQRIDELARELHGVRVELDRLRRADVSRRTELDEARDAVERATDERARAVRELKAMERVLARRTAELKAATGPVEAAAPTPGLLEIPQRAVIEVRAALQSMIDAVDALPRPPLEPSQAAGSVGGGSVARDTRRRPVRLGKGLIEDTVDAARWLMGRPGVLVLVDGYNVTMLGWPELTAAQQRDALARAATDLQVTSGAQVVLVFDGDAEGGSAVRTVGSPVRTRFTREGLEADDELLGLVDQASAPVVVVVSNDRRVLDGARQRGANTVRSSDFLALVR